MSQRCRKYSTTKTFIDSADTNSDEYTNVLYVDIIPSRVWGVGVDGGRGGGEYSTTRTSSDSG